MELILSAPLCDDCYHDKLWREWHVEKPKSKKILPMFGGKLVTLFDPNKTDHKTKT